MNSKKYDDRHGGPWDRGNADAYYGRPFMPHYYVGATGFTERVGEDRMTPGQIEAYEDGYREAVESGDFKDWG